MPETPFPPDDRSVGYERGTSISKAWDQATTDAAIEAADYVVAHLKELAGVGETTPARTARRSSASSAAQFAERAFRRPLPTSRRRSTSTASSTRRRDLETARQAGRAAGPEVAAVPLPRDRHRHAGRLRRGLAALVRALGLAPRPAALRGRGLRPAGHAASRSPRRPSGWSPTSAPGPSSASSSSSGSGSTRSPTSPRTRSLPRLRRGRRLRPADLARAVPRRRRSRSESADFRQLLLARRTLYLNGRLAQFYGADLPPDAPFRKVDLDAGRAGRAC